MAWTVDERFAPILLFNVLGKPTEEELSAYVAQIAAVTKRAREKNAKYVAIVVYDTMPDAKERARLAKAHEQISREQSRMIVATFVVVTNTIMRGVLTAMTWLMGDMLRTVRPVRSYDDALAGALETLRQLHVPAPNDVEQLRQELGLNRRRAAQG